MPMVAMAGIGQHAGEALEHTPAYSGKRRRNEILGWLSMNWGQPL
jgi:hypothetical protein